MVDDDVVHFGKRVPANPKQFKTWCGLPLRANTITVLGNWLRLRPERRCPKCMRRLRDFEQRNRLTNG